MARRTQRDRKLAAEYTRIAIRVDSYDVSVLASVNPYAYEPQYGWRDTEEEPLYTFVSHLEITGTAIHPTNCAGQLYELTIYGEDSPSSDIFARLKDVHALDEHNAPKYRAYRGKQVPVYVAPKGMSLIDKVPGESRWTGAIFVKPRFVSDLLLMLGRKRPLFMGLHVWKCERRRWLRSISLQTSDPTDE